MDLRREYGLDLAELWTARRWSELIAYIDLLPSASHTRQAMAQDEEHVEAVLEALDGRQPEQAPPLAEYGPEVARLDRIADLLKVIPQAIVASNGGKPHDVKPEPRPRTAFERVAERRRSAKHQQTVSRVLGARATPHGAPAPPDPLSSVSQLDVRPGRRR